MAVSKSGGTKEQNRDRDNRKAWSRNTGNQPPKPEDPAKTRVREERARARRAERARPGSNLTHPKIDWDWVTNGMRTNWKFDGRGSRRLRTMEAFDEVNRQIQADKVKSDTLSIENEIFPEKKSRKSTVKKGS